MNLKWQYTNKMVNDLIKIYQAKEIVDLLQLPVSIEEEIKKESLVKRVHYSTKIEGNSLNINEVKAVIENANVDHERNALEVRNYYNALLYLNKLAKKTTSINEDLVLKVHNLVVGKNVNYKNSFRDGQNVVQDSITGQLVYLPPEAKDVPKLIQKMLNDFNQIQNVLIPIKAGILAYQFVTIHPFWDGNGRCSRLLANFILNAYGCDLKGFYVLEEFYDKDIKEYYDSLQMNLHHNYYFGRNEADITPWLEYFISTMASSYEAVGKKVKEIYDNSKNSFNLIDTLDKRKRWVAS